MSHARISLTLLTFVLVLTLAWNAPAYADSYSSALPDLIITSIVFDPPSPSVGVPVNAVVTVKNQGQGQALIRAGNDILKPSPFGATLRAASDIVLQPGESKPFTVLLLPQPGVGTSGAYTIRFILNPSFLIAESNLTNNITSGNFTITPVQDDIPRLKIASLQYTPSTVSPNTILNFTVAVTNDGPSNAVFDIVYFNYSGSEYPLINDTSLPVTLAPGQVFQYRGHTNTTKPLPAGLQLFTIRAQGINAKSDFKTIQIAVVDPAGGSIGRPSLYIENLAPTTSSIDYGDLAIMSFDLANKGDGMAFFNPDAVMYNVRDGNTIVNSVKAAQDITYPPGRTSRQVLNILNLKPGKHTLTVTIDPGNFVTEKDETHHQATATVNVITTDICVGQVVATPSTADTKSNIKLDITIRNPGYKPWTYTGGEPFISYGAQGFAVNKLPAPTGVTIAPLGEYTTTVTLPPFTSSAGKYNIVVTVDQPGDPNPANNLFTLPVTITLPPIKSFIGSGSAPSQSAPPPTTINPLPPDKYIPPPTDGPAPGPSAPGN